MNRKRIPCMLITLFLSMLLVFPVYAQGTGQGQSGQDQSGQQGQTGMQQQGGQQMGQGQQAQSVTGNDLMGATVRGQEDNEIGEVSDLLVSQDGNVEYILVSEGGILGFGGEMAPIPWQQVQQINIQENEKTLTVAIDDQTFQDAPKFSGDEWEQMSMSEFDQQVRGYYGDSGQQGMQQPEIQKKESGATGQQGQQQQGGGTNQNQQQK